MALDSKGNLYRVGRDDFVRDSIRQRGRLLGHDAESGALILNKQLEPNTWIQGVLVDAEDNLYIACRLGVYAQADKLSDKCRTVVQKLDPKGRMIWERALPAEGIAPNPKGLLRRDAESFYVAFQQLCEGIWLPGVAEMTYDGELRWMGLIDRPGWEAGNSGYDARDGVIYVGLTNSADQNQTQVVALKP
jgi:hypothetical protein